VANLKDRTSNAVNIRHRFIAAKYKAHARDKRPPKRGYSLTAQTLNQLERLFRSRWGSHLPDDDAGQDDLRLALNYVRGIEAKIAWAAKWAPWLSREDAEELTEEIAAAPRWLKARALGERLGLTDRERTALDIDKIRPIDVTDAELAERRRQDDRERKRRKRQAARAAKPAPASQTKPWEAEGISKRTWHRRRAKPGNRKRGTKSVRDNLETLTADGICATTPPAIAVGTPAAEPIGLVPALIGTNSESTAARVDGAAVGGNPDSEAETTITLSDLIDYLATRGFGAGEAAEIAHKGFRLGIESVKPKSETENPSCPLKTRFPTAWRLSKEQREYARSAGFTAAQIDNMFEHFHNWNLAKGNTWSDDWERVWFDWVDREVDFVNKWHERERRRAYFERRAA
jgi:hypothetical protein